MQVSTTVWLQCVYGSAVFVQVGACSGVTAALLPAEASHVAPGYPRGSHLVKLHLRAESRWEPLRASHICTQAQIEFFFSIYPVQVVHKYCEYLIHSYGGREFTRKVRTSFLLMYSYVSYIDEYWCFLLFFVVYCCLLLFIDALYWYCVSTMELVMGICKLSTSPRYVSARREITYSVPIRRFKDNKNF